MTSPEDTGALLEPKVNKPEIWWVGQDAHAVTLCQSHIGSKGWLEHASYKGSARPGANEEVSSHSNLAKRPGSYGRGSTSVNWSVHGHAIDDLGRYPVNAFPPLPSETSCASPSHLLDYVKRGGHQHQHQRKVIKSRGHCKLFPYHY